MSWHEATVRVTNKQGLHARPIVQFTKLAMQFQAEIQVAKKERVADGKSPMSMMTLEATCGSQLRIRARGADAAQAVRKLKELVASEFPIAPQQEVQGEQ